MDRIKEEGLPDISEVELNIRSKVLVEKEEILLGMEAAASSSKSAEELAGQWPRSGSDLRSEAKLHPGERDRNWRRARLCSHMSSHPINELFLPYAGDRAVFVVWWWSVTQPWTKEITRVW